MGEGDDWPAVRTQVLASEIPIIATPTWDYLDEERGHDWAAKTGQAMARNLATVARALVATPMQAPPE